MIFNLLNNPLEAGVIIALAFYGLILDRLQRLPLLGRAVGATRRLGPVPLIEAVRVLCGSAYAVVIDPVHRLLSCEIKSQYAAIGGKRP